jgi:DNA-binding IclR family transcriptional regulator
VARTDESTNGSIEGADAGTDEGSDANIDERAAASKHAQTLSRGIRALELLADAPGPMTIAELAAALDVHRSIAYRILRTLEDHRMVVRDAAGRVELGPRLAALARTVQHDLQAAALPELTAVANDLGMTAFVAVLDQREVVTLVSVEPRHVVATVAQRPGTRHPLANGAPGIAIQSALTEAQWSALGGPERVSSESIRPEAVDARTSGYAVSHDEVIRGLRSVAVPLVVPGQLPAAVAVVFVASASDDAQLGARLADAAGAITAAMR